MWFKVTVFINNKVMPTSRTELLFNAEFARDGNKGYIFLSGTTESEQTSTLSLKAIGNPSNTINTNYSLKWSGVLGIETIPRSPACTLHQYPNVFQSYRACAYYIPN